MPFRLVTSRAGHARAGWVETRFSWGILPQHSLTVFARAAFQDDGVRMTHLLSMVIMCCLHNWEPWTVGFIGRHGPWALVEET